MKEIPLTQGQTAIIDEEDYSYISQYKWRAGKNGNKLCAIRTALISGKRKTVRMHRIIADTPAGMQTDHINGNSMDNRKENLRICTNQQNSFNRKKPNKNNKLGIKGVQWVERIKKFRAQIRINDKTIHLGLFTVASNADNAYRKAEEKYFGEFAR